MESQENALHRPALPKFVRVVGTIWLVALAAILIGALLAPHLGRLADLVLHLTVQRAWTSVQVWPEAPVFDASTPLQTVRSYYSALYRGDVTQMDQLTYGPFRQQMRQRLALSEPLTENTVYRSYLRLESRDGVSAYVLEKFHLFWQQGLRFQTQRVADTWRIVRVTSVR
jgi:hypothetical protein